MPNDSLSTANYAAVINDLRAKRDELDRAIATLEAMIPRTALPPVEQPAAPIDPSPPQRPLEPRRVASGNSGIGEVCTQILREREGKTLSTREVTDLLVASDFELNGTNPVNNVWNALNNRSKVKRDIRRVGKGWRYVGGEKAAYTQPDTAHVNGLAAHE